MDLKAFVGRKGKMDQTFAWRRIANLLNRKKRTLFLYGVEKDFGQ